MLAGHLLTKWQEVSSSSLHAWQRFFTCVMLCISTAVVVERCLSVCLSICHDLVLCSNSFTYCQNSFTTWRPRHQQQNHHLIFKWGPLTQVGIQVWSRTCDTHCSAVVLSVGSRPSVLHGNSRYEQFPNISSRFQFAILQWPMVTDCAGRLGRIPSVFSARY